MEHTAADDRRAVPGRGWPGALAAGVPAVALVLVGAGLLVGRCVEGRIEAEDRAETRIEVSVEGAGFDPAFLDEQVAGPVAERVGRIHSIGRVETETAESGVLVIAFVAGPALEAESVVDEVARSVEVVELPEECGEPVVSLERPTVLVSVLAVRPDEATELAARLERVPGVAAVEAEAGRAALVVVVDPVRLEAFGLSFEEVAAKIRADLLAGGPGFEPVDPRRLEEVVLRVDPDGAPVRLADLAAVVSEARGTGWEIDGEPCARLEVRAAAGRDLPAVCQAVRSAALGGGAREWDAADRRASIGRAFERHAGLGVIVMAILSFLISIRIVVRVAARLPVSLPAAIVVGIVLLLAAATVAALDGIAEFAIERPPRHVTCELRMPPGTPAPATRQAAGELIEAAGDLDPSVRHMIGVDEETARVEILFADPAGAAHFAGSPPALPGLDRLQVALGGPTAATRSVFEVVIRGEDRERLLEAARRVEGELTGRPGVRSVDAGDLERRAAWRLTLRPDAPLGARDAAARIRRSVGPVRIRDVEPTVLLRLDGAGPAGVADLAGVRVLTPEGLAVPLEAVADVEVRMEPSVLRRIDGRPAVRLSVDGDASAVEGLGGPGITVLRAGHPGRHGGQPTTSRILRWAGPALAVLLAFLVLFGALGGSSRRED